MYLPPFSVLKRAPCHAMFGEFQLNYLDMFQLYTILVTIISYFVPLHVQLTAMFLLVHKAES
jgi:hypothetical protein